MSEKRFVVQEDANTDKIILLIDYKRMKMYSFLAEEREAVNKICNYLNWFDEYAEQIVEENHKFRIEKNDLRIENKGLRKTINEVIELLTEEVDLFSDKATEHDIIAYKEMNEFDNKDAYYMCVSTKKAIKMLQGCL